MEWSWKTLLIFIVIALMIGILIDGFRRMRRNQAAALRLDVKGDFNLTDDDDFNSELPSGGARVVSDARTTPATEPTVESTMDSPIYANDDSDDDNRSHTETSDDEHALSVDDDDRRAHESSLDRADEQAAEPADGRSDSDDGAKISTPKVRPKATQASECSEQDAEQNKEKNKEISDKAEQKAENETNTTSADAAPVSVHFDEPAPVLLNVEEMGSGPEQSDSMAAANTAPESASSTQDSSTQDSSTQDNSKQSNGNDDEAKQQEQNPTYHQPLEETPIEPSAAQAASVDGEANISDDVADPVEHAAVKVANVMRPGDHAERLEERESAQEVLVVHVIAQKGTTFSGEDLLYVFNSCDLRLGERDIFHRFEENNGNGRVQFSVSQAYEPGSFDASVLLSQSFSGLSFFMSLPGPKKPLDAYEAMSEMAQFVARNLKGDLLDDSHSAMTMQTMEHHREKIMDFERKQRLKGKSK